MTFKVKDGISIAGSTLVDGNRNITANSVTAPVITANVAQGTAPLVITSTTVVANLNADLLDGQQGAYYTNATNLATGTVPAARLPQANTTSNGAVILLDSVSNTSVSVYAPTANAVKTAYDAAITANTNASNASFLASGTVAAARMPAFTGDATAPAGTANLTLVNTAVTAGTYGNASSIPAFTVDSKGRITNVTETAVAGVSGYAYTPANNTFTITTSAGGSYNATIGTVNAISVTGVLTASANVNVTGNVTATGTFIAPTLTSNVATGTAPLTVTSTTKVTNLNADLLDDQTGAYYTNATNLATGTVPAARLPQANATSNGAVLILDSVTNTSISVYAASANSVKTAYDKAVSEASTAYSNATTYAATIAGTAYSNATTYSSNASNLTSGTVADGRLTKANTTANGVVMLLDSVSNTATSGYAPTPNAVKTAYDAAVTANTNASNASFLSSGTVGDARLTKANTTANGVVMLLDSVSNTSVASYAPTANAVKTAYDAAITANTNASNATFLSSGTVAAARLPAFTGDATAPAGTANLTLANTAVTAGTYGNSSVIPQITVDSKGRITSASNIASPGLSSFAYTAANNTFAIGKTDGGTLTATISTVNSFTVSQDLVVSGNLTVSGTTTYVNSTQLNIGDNIITLNADLPGASAPTENAGIEINRGSSANVQLVWKESSDEWSYGNTAVAGYVNATSTITGTQLVSTIATGTKPLAVTSTTLVDNLNADLLDGNHASAFALSGHNHSGTYQPLDADLTSIAGLAGTSGFLKKTAADTWSLDTSTYLTGNQTVTLSGDATGSGATSIAVTLAASGVTAGTYTKVTVDAKGRVTTGASLASADLPTYTGTLTSSQITTGLGYTPYNSTNPNGYVTSSGTVNASYRSIVEDTRAGQRTPNDYDDYRASYEFTNAIVSGWHSAFTMQGWTNGYSAWQLIGPADTGIDETLYFRSGVNTSWNTLRTILHSGNYNSYSPTLTGTGASGTWGINITGSAATATTATNQSGGTVSGTTGSFSSTLSVGAKIQRTAAGTGYLDGNYNSVETVSTSGAIYSIGGSYVPGTTTLGNMYGVGYTYSGGAAGNPGGVPSSVWGMYVASAGTARIWLDSDNGRGYFNSSLYATLLYDKDNTAYYIDPASTSNLNGLTVAATITGSVSGSAGSVAASGITGQTGMWTSAARPGPYRLYRNDDNNAYNVQTTWSADVSGYWSLRGYLNDTYHAACYVAYAGYAPTIAINYSNDSNSTYQMLWGSGSSVYGTGGIYCNPSSDILYAAAFYDANDTAYYCDPNGTSSFNAAYVYGSWYFKSAAGSGGYSGSVNGARLQAYSDDGGAAMLAFHRSGAYAVNMGLDPDNVLRIGGWSAGANRLQLDMSGNMWTASSMRSNIFYDQDDTNYYCDPNSTSRLSKLNVVSSMNAQFYENENTITASYSITSNRNAMTAGPVTINNGVTITIPNGSVWTVV